MPTRRASCAARPVLIQTIGRAARNVDGKVILYADQMTGSMERAMAETDRRREKQTAWNTANGITPESIKQQHPRRALQRLRAGPRHGRCRPRRGRQATLIGHNLEAVIADLEKKMRAGGRRPRVRDGRAPARRDQAPAPDRARHRRRSPRPPDRRRGQSRRLRGDRKYGPKANMPASRKGACRRTSARRGAPSPSRERDRVRRDRARGR